MIPLVVACLLCGAKSERATVDTVQADVLVDDDYTLLRPSIQDGTKHAHWDYDHKAWWKLASSDRKPEYPDCNPERKGHRQSPISLDEDLSATTSGQKLLDSTSYTELLTRELKNNGHSMQVDGDFGKFTAHGKVFLVKQFHFHFPAEHETTTNSNGKLVKHEYDGEMHIVHKSDDGEYAVIGVFLKVKAGEDGDQFFKDLRFGTDALNGLPDEGQASPVGTVDLGKFAAEHLEGDFWRYEGSLTTPPCSEPVHWFVMKDPVAVTSAFAKNFKAKEPVGAKKNNRPIQQVNGRNVELDPDLSAQFDDSKDNPKSGSSMGEIRHKMNMYSGDGIEPDVLVDNDDT